MHHSTDRIAHTTAFVTPVVVNDEFSTSLVMFRLTMYSTHFYLRLYGVKAYDKGSQSDSKRVNLLPPLHRLLFAISSKVSFISTIPERG